MLSIQSCCLDGALLCAILTACSSNATLHEEDVIEGTETPMQFSEAAISSAVTRASSTNYLSQGFLVSCWKNFGSTNPQTVMSKYEVKYQTDLWSNESKWNYVGSTSDGFYQTQAERYWDEQAFPYGFYAISPCPSSDEIADFELSSSQLSIPSTVSFQYQTGVDGVLSAGAEPFMPAQVICPDGSNEKDMDLLNNSAVISKNASYNGATTSYDRYVALPFHHFTSKVRFAIYSDYAKLTPDEFHLYNIKVKVVSENFVTEGQGYEADLKNGNMLTGSFLQTVLADDDADRLLLQTTSSKWGDLNVAVDRDHAYYCECADGLLQIPQTGVQLTLSFDVSGLEYDSDFTSADGQIVYDQASHVAHYTDIPIQDKSNNLSAFDWESNYIYTYMIKVSEFYPLTIDFSAELTPWTDVYGSIETNLEK